MANLITNSQLSDEIIKMGNGLTSVFIETICLAGSDIAIEQYEKDILIWFGQRDWNILGMGFEGFDIVEIIWNKENFYMQQKFILRIIDLAIEKTNWNRLNYIPSEMIFTSLLKFRQMIEGFRIEFLKPEKEIPIFEFDGSVQRYDICDKHRIYKHFQGCVICNNETINNI